MSQSEPKVNVLCKFIPGDTTIIIDSTHKDINDYKLDNIKILEYTCHPSIKMEMRK